MSTAIRDVSANEPRLPQAGWMPLAPNPCGATGLLALAGVSAGLAEGSVGAGILWMTLIALSPVPVFYSSLYVANLPLKL